MTGPGALTAELHLFWPEGVLALAAFGVLTADLVLPRGRRNLWGAALALLGLAAVLAVTVPLSAGRDASLYGGLVRVDAFTFLFRVLFVGMAAFTVLTSVDYVRRHLAHPGEYYGLLLLGTLGMVLMAAATELLTAYIALELASFSLYVLAAYARGDARSNEAGTKYILLGAFSSAVLLYGISLVYTGVGATRYADVAAALAQGGVPASAGVGLALVLVGLGFKVAAVPFHMWAPDVYEGAPTPVTAFIAVASKAAGFAFLLRLFGEGLLPAIGQWQGVVAVLAAVTMTVGNLVALAQRNIKRLLAYSSIGQVGYLLMGIAALSDLTSNGVNEHLVGYAFTNLAVFAAVIAVQNATGGEEFKDLNGLADRHPFLAAAITMALFSLAGLPFFAGFTTKFYLFTATAAEGLLWLATLAVLLSLVSLYYSLVVIRHLYIEPAPQGAGRLRVSPLLTGTVAALTVGVILVGVYPQPFVAAVEAASRALLGS